jgi:uncharacterized membrane protein YraQ (UPF0718 family)
MKKKFDCVSFTKFVAIVFCLVVLVVTTGCAINSKTEKSKTMSIIGQAETVGKALGCLFGCAKQPKDNQ